MKRILIFLLSFAFMLTAQAQVGIGQFRDHLANNRFYSVAVSNDYIYVAAQHSISYLSKSQADAWDFSFSKWSKTNGLSDVEIAKIACGGKKNSLVIAYMNGNIDIINGDELYNVPDVKNKQINGSKQVRQIRFSGNNCYLIYSFGAVILDLNTFLVKDTWYSGHDAELSFYDFAETDGKYYMATSQGVFSIENNNHSVADFSVWNKENKLAHQEFNILSVFQGKVYANRHSFRESTGSQERILDSVFVLENGHWHYQAFEIEELKTMEATESELLLTNWQNFVAYDGQNSDSWGIYEGGRLPNLVAGAIDRDFVWLCDRDNGLWMCHRPTGSIKLIEEDGPFSNQVFNLSCEHGVLAAVPGGYNIYAPAYLDPACSFFSGNKWSYTTDFQYIPFSHDMINVVVCPIDPTISYVASWGCGLYKCVDGKVVAHYDENNSTLKVCNNGMIFVSGLSFDAYGNLWVTNTNSPTTINVLKTDGTWKAMTKLASQGDEDVAQYIYVDSRGFKWITFPRNASSSHSLCVFYDNNTIDNPSDDVLRAVNMNANAHVETSSVKCITEDKDGEMWIGTNKGIKVIYNPAKVFDGTALPQNILLEQGGYTSVLLEFEEITSIAVDGANRKWISTAKAGAFLMNESGTEEILHLTAENSSLLSNVVYDIAIDGITGEVFFATDKGLCSYRGTASEGREDYSEVSVFPNPVHSGYSGPIAVNGLMENSFCKVVDAAGNLIWQGYAKGGQLIWDGKDFKGRRPATGVFFVFASDKTGKQKKVAKLLFIN